ncbi:MAG: spore germination protein [Bacillota bacterium]
MSIWQSLKRWLDPSATLVDDTFSLGNRGEKPASEEQGAEMLSDARIRTESVLTRIDRLLEASPQGPEALEKVGDLSDSLDENLRRIRELFRLPDNKDLVIRDIIAATQPPTRAAVLFMEGLTNTEVINDHVLQPLMLLAHLDHHTGQGGEHGPTQPSVETVKLRLLPGNQTSEKHDMASVVESLLMGDTVVLLDGNRTALAVETKKPPTRSVGEPKNENVVWGPYDAFNEAVRTNIALVRRRLKDPRVVTELLTVGEVSKTIVGLMYIDTIASPKLVAEAKRRIEAIKVDIVNGAGILEQYIEDSPTSLLPSTLITERPDRAAAYLSEGHVALFVDNTPYAIVVPVTFWSLIQTAEDYYLRWPFGAILRYIRLTAILLALTLPALYIGIINYHQEMIPTELMLFIASTREPVPMPAVVELLVMDVAFELIREAGTRIPSVIGPTIGLVAGLVLGNAAVEAKIVSPLMIVVVAITGLSSFAIPNYLVGWGVRVMRFLLLALSVVLGFFGVAAALFVLVVIIAAQRSFGVPYLSPVAPTRGKIKDIFNRNPLYRMEERPPHLRTLDKKRQEKVVRSWDPLASKSNPEEKGG